jgi:hypothetical protein
MKKAKAYDVAALYFHILDRALLQSKGDILKLSIGQIT